MAKIKICILIAILLTVSSAARKLPSKINSDSDEDTMPFQYHNGTLLTGKISVNLIWYGKFNPSQKAIITDLITSLTKSATPSPSVQNWWKITEKYYRIVKKYSSPNLKLGRQISDERYSLGKSLAAPQLQRLSRRGGRYDSVNVVLTSSDVAVEGFCSSRCGTHSSLTKLNNYKFAYIWVGNSATQCPGYCAWPFHRPIYGPQSPPLIAPNGDVGLDGMVINLFGLLASAVTDPFGDGFYQGPKLGHLEAGSACAGIYAKGAYPGYPGDLLVDPKSGGSFNARGVNGRRYLLPAIYDPADNKCATLV